MCLGAFVNLRFDVGVGYSEETGGAAGSARSLGKRKHASFEYNWDGGKKALVEG